MAQGDLARKMFGVDLKEQAERDAREYLVKTGLRSLFPPAEWLDREAETLSLSNIQLRGYLDLIAAGEYPFNALNLMSRVPDVSVRECVEILKTLRGRW